MKKLIYPITLMLSLYSMAQIKQGERKEDIKQGSVVINRKYEPNVKAAEKIKQSPHEDTKINKKYQPSYTLKDVKAASDFETSTINAEQLPIDPSSNYPNYIELGYGNNQNMAINSFVSYDRDQNNSFGINVGYRSAKANLNRSLTRDRNSNLILDGFYRHNLENSMIKVGLGTNIKSVDLYGYSSSTIKNEIGKNNYLSYTNLNAYGTYKVFDNYLIDEVNAKYDFLSNNFKSRENNLKLDASLGSKDLFNFNFLGSESFGLTAKMDLELLSTSFNEEFSNQEKKYSFFKTSITPQLAWLNDFLDIMAGAKIEYLNGSENSLDIMPNIEITAKPTAEFRLFGGINSGVDLKSYKNLINFNPYLFGHQELKPSINKFGLYAGIKGDVNRNIKYSFVAGYQKMKNIIGFIKLPIQPNNNASFGYGNTFHSYYDNGNKNYLNAEVNYLGIKSLEISANIAYQNYNLDNIPTIYEIPRFNANISSLYKLLNQKLELGADLIFVGAKTGWIGLDPINGKKIKIDPYLDLNLNANYRITNQFSILLKGQNLFNKNYQRFTDYNVQGLHIIGGLMFLF